MATLLALSGPAAVGAVSPTGFADSGPVSQPPTIGLTLGSRIASGGVPLTISWPHATPDSAPIAHYELQRSLDGGGWTDITLPGALATTVVVRTPPFATLRFRVRAVDTANVSGDWSESEPRWMTAAQETDSTVHLSASWTLTSDRTAYRKKRSTTTTAGETATFDFVGREVAWVARRGPTMGSASVSVDGGGASFVDLYRSSKSNKTLVFRQSWPTVGPHTVQISVASTGLSVDVDAFVVLADPVNRTLVGAGDIAVCTTSYDSATADLVSAVLGDDATAEAFTAGDNTYPDGSPSNFANCYDPTWGVFKARTHPAIGNHEFYNNPGAAGYFSYFGAAAGYPGRGYYRYDVGTWRVYALTSECEPGSACDTAQYKWLRADLIAEPHRCVMAIWHRPLFSTGEHGNSARMAALFKLLYDNGADLVVTGHDHGYQRFAPSDSTGALDPGRGIRQFVVATGGASLYAFPTDSALLEVRDNTSHGVIKLTLKPGSYAFDFLPIPGDTFTDSSQDTCH
jgi:hypothetical protein